MHIVNEETFYKVEKFQCPYLSTTIPCITYHGDTFLKRSLMMFLSLLLLPGCSAKLPFCKSNPCQNGGTCRVSWETFSCDCPLGYGGKDCSHGETLHELILFLWSHPVSCCGIIRGDESAAKLLQSSVALLIDVLS